MRREEDEHPELRQRRDGVEQGMLLLGEGSTEAVAADAETKSTAAPDKMVREYFAACSQIIDRAQHTVAALRSIALEAGRRCAD